MNTRIANRRQFLKDRATPLTIAFTAIADFSSFIGQEYIAGIMAAANDYGLQFINMADATRHALFVDVHFLDEYLAKFSFMRPPLIDGLITWASSLCEYMEKERVQTLFASLHPLPMVDIGYLDIPGVSSIRVDNAYSIHLLVEHLVHSHGFKKIAFMGSLSSKPHLSRLEYFKQEISAAGLTCDEANIYMADSIAKEDVQKTIQALIERYRQNGPRSIEAVLTTSDIIAALLIEELERQGISVPEDIAVTGYNNQYSGITATSPITTIDLAYFKRGYEAVEQLIDRIMGTDTDVPTYRVKTSLVVRQSCGCFEQSIFDALKSENKSSPDQTSENDIRSYLNAELKTIFPLDQNRLTSLTDAVIADMYESAQRQDQSHTLTWFRAFFKEKRASAATSEEDFESQISALRRTILPLVREIPEQRDRMENICHAVRALHAVFARYDLIARRWEPFTFANMTNIALSFTSTSTLAEFENVLNYRLIDIGSSGITIVLSPNMTNELSQGEVSIVIPPPEVDVAESLPQRVREPAVFPKKLLPPGQRNFTLTLLCANGMYMGYAFIQMSSNTITLYDTLKELLSQTLYNIYVHEGRIKNNTLVVHNRANLKAKIKKQNQAETQKTSSASRFTAEELMNYLIDHLNEMTDLDKIAEHFHISTSHLARRSKALTGYSVQVLHERLKIEQAKDLIRAGTMKMLDISVRLGFSNPNYFSNVFKKVTGESPRTWAVHNKREF